MQPHRVVVLAINEIVGYDLEIPPKMFLIANEDGTRRYHVRICGVDDQPVRVTSGYQAVLDHGPEALEKADTVVIPGTRHPDPRKRGVLFPALADALTRIPAGARIMSTCTGAFVLGAAGLLDGKKATTHWAYADEFRALFPKVELDENVLFVDEGRLLTSAGLSAAIDLCLHVIRTDYGSKVAGDVARFCVVPPWREGGQAQFIDRPLPEPTDGSTARTREWALRKLSEPLDLATMAAHAHMSVRTFSRRFVAETGQSPRAWLTQQRIQHARQLLEETDLPIDVVAARSGLGSAVSLRQHFHATLGVAPGAYRRTFSAQLG